MHEGSRRVKRIGEIVFAYEPVRAIDTSGAVSNAARELRRLETDLMNILWQFMFVSRFSPPWIQPREGIFALTASKIVDTFSPFTCGQKHFVMQ